jgi:hypothetical protein
MLVSTGDLKVAQDGDYVLGTTANGVRSFTPQGNFVRQYGDGDSRGVTFVPGGRLWSGGNSTTVNIFDFGTGDRVGSFTLDQQINGSSMRYSAVTNTVLVVDADRDAGGVFERDLAGHLLHEFHVPQASTYCRDAVRLPGSDVYGTHDVYAPLYPDLIHWGADGTVLEERTIWPREIKTGRILWTGSVPEPATSGLAVAFFFCLLKRNRRKPEMSGSAD